MLEIRTDGLSAEVFLSLYASVGREPPCREQIRDSTIEQHAPRRR